MHVVTEPYYAPHLSSQSSSVYSPPERSEKYFPLDRYSTSSSSSSSTAAAPTSASAAVAGGGALAGAQPRTRVFHVGAGGAPFSGSSLSQSHTSGPSLASFAQQGSSLIPSSFYSQQQQQQQISLSSQSQSSSLLGSGPTTLTSSLGVPSLGGSSYGSVSLNHHNAGYAQAITSLPVAPQPHYPHQRSLRFSAPAPPPRIPPIPSVADFEMASIPSAVQRRDGRDGRGEPRGGPSGGASGGASGGHRGYAPAAAVGTSASFAQNHAAVKIASGTGRTAGSHAATAYDAYPSHIASVNASTKASGLERKSASGRPRVKSNMDLMADSLASMNMLDTSPSTLTSMANTPTSLLYTSHHTGHYTNHVGGGPGGPGCALGKGAGAASVTGAYKQQQQLQQQHQQQQQQQHVDSPLQSSTSTSSGGSPGSVRKVMNRSLLPVPKSPISPSGKYASDSYHHHRGDGRGSTGSLSKTGPVEHPPKHVRSRIESQSPFTSSSYAMPEGVFADHASSRARPPVAATLATATTTTSTPHTAMAVKADVKPKYQNEHPPKPRVPPKDAAYRSPDTRRTQQQKQQQQQQQQLSQPQQVSPSPSPQQQQQQRPISARIPTSTLRDLKLPLSPEATIIYYNDLLTPYEQREIYEFKEIYFAGAASILKIGGAKRKTGADLAETCNAAGTAKDDDKSVYNSGYDDSRGDYYLTKHDHVGYRYEILSLLGKGSFGQVVKCYDHKTKSNVALKIIRNKKRFEKQGAVEVKVLERLKMEDSDDTHSIVHMVDSFLFRGHLCITFELLGMNLYEWLKAGGFRGVHLGVIKSFTVQMLHCLDLLSRSRIVHCDLKPENILLQDPSLTHPSRLDGNAPNAAASGTMGGETLGYRIKVIDFGSSCFEDEKIYTYVQSRFYRSPEVILGISYNASIDMWSLGCILTELYTGYPLFPGENETEQLACIMELKGLPPPTLLDRSTRRKNFFDGPHPRIVPNSKGKKRRPDTKSLSSVLRADPLFVDFVNKCLEWDPIKRMRPCDALLHEWITGRRSERSEPLRSERWVYEKPPTTTTSTITTTTSLSIPSVPHLSSVSHQQHQQRGLPPIDRYTKPFRPIPSQSFNNTSLSGAGRGNGRKRGASGSVQVG
ncbi:hypothetical protein SpCBS45565_g01845 [Spizellomyces sp. 'palustris']|nr:hypothetical protein SpCBS45565_g01845 [Spizellomyces sp. 'palustris']